MYNLLMARFHNEWEQNQDRWHDVRFLKGRVFEQTDDAVEEQFTGSDGPDFDALIKLPCLFTYEGEDVVGVIGRINKVKRDNWRFEIDYTLPNTYPKIVMNEKRVFEALGMGAFQAE